MTLQAPTHSQGLYLRNHFHFINSTMTGFTTYTVVGMNFMAEIGIIWQFVDLNPLNGFVHGPAFPNRKQF